MTNSTLLPVNPNGEYVYHAAGMLPGWQITSCSHSSKDPITLDNIDDVMGELSTGVGKPEHILDIIYLAATLVMDGMDQARLERWRKTTCSEIINL